MTKKETFPTLPTSTPHAGHCPLCGSNLRKYSHRGASFITCPNLYVGGGFHSPTEGR